MSRVVIIRRVKCFEFACCIGVEWRRHRKISC